MRSIRYVLLAMHTESPSIYWLKGLKLQEKRPLRDAFRNWVVSCAASTTQEIGPHARTDLSVQIAMGSPKPVAGPIS